VSVDLVIVGGGIQGATAACEATRRGSSVLLLERDDLGAGASSSSMRIAHGGLRYLQGLDLRRSRQSIRERRRLLRLAPDWVRPLGFRLDLSGRGPAYRAAFAVGLLLNDLVAFDRNRGVRPDRRLPAGRVPVWHDAFIADTERLLLAFLHTAARRHPGTLEVRTRTAVTDLLRDRGRVVGVRTSDGEEIRAGAVVDCAGVWAGRLGRSAGTAILSMNLVVPRPDLVGDGVAVALRHPRDGRNVFVVPWEEAAIVGTSNRRVAVDDPVEIDPASVAATLDWVGGAHPELGRLTPADVRLVHAGLVPADPHGSDPSDTEGIDLPAPGLVVVRGVKWTTAYGLSERAVALARNERMRAFPPIDAPGTGDGGAGVAPVLEDGVGARDAYVAARPGATEAVAPGSTVRDGDVRFAVDEEWAKTLADVLLRRLGVAARGHPGRDVVRGVARVLADHLGWDEARTRAEIDAFEADFRVGAPLHSA